MAKPFRIIQMSDLHLLAEINDTLLNVPTHESVKSLIDLIWHDSTKPDLIILSGDISQDGSKNSYLHAINLFKKLNLPIYTTPGNHDDNSVLMHLLPLENFS